MTAPGGSGSRWSINAIRDQYAAHRRVDSRQRRFVAPVRRRKAELGRHPEPSFRAWRGGNRLRGLGRDRCCGNCNRGHADIPGGRHPGSRRLHRACRPRASSRCRFRHTPRSRDPVAARSAGKSTSNGPAPASRVSGFTSHTKVRQLNTLLNCTIAAQPFRFIFLLAGFVR